MAKIVEQLSGKLRIAFISPYPPPKSRYVYGSGVAPYTKSLIEAIGGLAPNIEIHVIADQKIGVPKHYIENNITIHRVYNKTPLYIFQIFRELSRIKPDIVHIQHEYFLYGGPLTATLFPLLIVLSKLTSKKVIVTLHGVLPLKIIEDSGFRQENGIRGPVIILKIALLLVTRLIALFSDKIVVHETFLKEFLIKDYKANPKKIVIIPHGVENFSPIPNDEAKKILGFENKKILLYFGYLTGYKGIKELLHAYGNVAKSVSNTILIIAGGPHPRLVKESWYRNWIRDIIKRALNIQHEIGDKGRIIFTGYVPEDKIPLFFSAADVVILPYKARIASSGPEALAIAFERCYILRYVDAKKVDIFTSLIVKILTDIENCQKISNKLKRQRMWNQIARYYLYLYYAT